MDPNPLKLLDYLPPSIAGLLAGAVLSYLGISHLYSDRIASLESEVKEARADNKQLETELLSLKKQNIELKSSLSTQEDRFRYFVPKEQLEAEQHNLSAADSKVSELTSKLNSLLSSKLIPAHDVVSVSSVWSPWGEIGPNFSFDRASNADAGGLIHGVGLLAISSNAYKGTKIFSVFGPDSRHTSETFTWRGNKYVMCIRDFNYQTVDIAVYPSSITGNDKSDQTADNCQHIP